MARVSLIAWWTAELGAAETYSAGEGGHAAGPGPRSWSLMRSLSPHRRIAAIAAAAALLVAVPPAAARPFQHGLQRAVALLGADRAALIDDSIDVAEGLRARLAS